ncbi:MAG: terminase gpA endonuclease subunit, partial [Pseudomonadota bacterium]|nr:terminase gpA endonuclease subunit [Pseudomonadota bacterium]
MAMLPLAAVETLDEVLRAWHPPERIGTAEWARRYRHLSAEASALPGKYNIDLTPWVEGILDALDDPDTWKVVCMKAAQVAWTDGVVNNFIGARIDVEPCPMIMMFPKRDSAKEYSLEKFRPMVNATPTLSDKVDVRTSRKDGNTVSFKKFPGGFLKMVGSNSPANVKSSPAPVVIVEEPDDANTNIKGQGDSIKLLEERTKTFRNRMVVFGGTPSVAGLSIIDANHANSDQRRFFVPCHECGESHVMDWDQVSWDQDPAARHEIYGAHRPETARYACPHCGAIWDDATKNANVRLGEWRATAEFRGIAGFQISELYSPFPNSSFTRLVERYLEAEKKFREGDDTEKIVFVNSALGKPYEYEGDAADPDVLARRAEDYPEMLVPAGGL